jgi:3D-(3,5/4)-trihydroxycyclohexane-1,2-dione acylhydrolase (decyclizing)
LGTALCGLPRARRLDRLQADERKAWDAYVADNVSYGNRPNSYAQAIGVVNALCDPRDRVVAAAGGLPAEVTANWRTLDIGTVDVEFGYSCMGYEIAGGWGARIAQSDANRTRIPSSSPATAPIC